MEIRHVIPNRDVLEHDVGPSCFCAPRHMPCCHVLLIVHNAADAREHMEDLRIRRTNIRG